MFTTLALFVMVGGIPAVVIVACIILYLTRDSRRAMRRKQVINKANKGDFSKLTKREREYAKEYAKQKDMLNKH